ncbi:MAG: flagellar basal body rod protein FlgB [Syntrophomonadaceae bacterium]|nr:flagellar basal body rod protein FlgB [Syntrophomonadaceae bacterium]
MLNAVIGNRAMDILEKALDGASLRQQVITNNMAHVDTPGYKAMEVSFEDQLQEAIRDGRVGARLRTSHTRHLQIGNPVDREYAPRVSVLTGYKYRNDQNSVDIDREMARLAKNSIYYDAMARSMNNEFRLLRMAITEGRR